MIFIYCCRTPHLPCWREKMIILYYINTWNYIKVHFYWWSHNTCGKMLQLSSSNTSHVYLHICMLTQTNLLKLAFSHSLKRHSSLSFSNHTSAFFRCYIPSNLFRPQTGTCVFCDVLLGESCDPCLTLALKKAPFPEKDLVRETFSLLNCNTAHCRISFLERESL